MSELYPSGPGQVPLELTKPTAAYRNRAWLAVASLALFVVLYVALAGWFSWTAYRTIGEAMAGSRQSLMFFIIGGGAAFLALFMLKALFFIKRGGDPAAVEVTAAEQPALFDFLHRLADEAGAPWPKRVYLSARVNAAVFYDLSILNLVLPSRKNLEIGLALVNVLTLSEFKAVLAHEFGHFAQRSMAIGSWVYIAQQIASHIIAKRDALDKFLRVLSGIDLRVAWLGWLLSLVVWSIRSLMDTLLRLVVLAQRSLSRQMEFQADLVAVSLTGSDELVHALHKLQAADEAWERTLGFANAEMQQGRLPHDLFAVHGRIIEKVAQILDDDSYGQVPPAIGKDPRTHRVFKTSFAQPPQMWSTHPANADREENSKRTYLAAPHDERSAWLLFHQVETVKDQVVRHLLGEAAVEPTTAERTFQALDASYARRRYEPRFRGAYLGRALTRHETEPEALYDEEVRQGDLRQAMEGLYSPDLAADLTHLRDLEEERAILQALRDKVYRATGGRIVHRGREISRRELPGAIRQVVVEEEEVRERVLAHDRRCRSLHLAAAAQLGGGHREYLIGLIELLHYAEHTLADLQDAHGAFQNVVAVVTADGKVSSRELKRLIAAANMLQEVLARIFADKGAVFLDRNLLVRLDVANWAEALEEFQLPPASKGNINDWMRVIDGWVASAEGALSALVAATLEQLLFTEDEVAGHLRNQTRPVDAPAPSRVPGEYPTLPEGQERKRQRRLGLWDRFQTADGLIPACARLLVAGLVVGTVLGFGSIAGSTTPLSVYNGLGQKVHVSAAGHELVLAPFSTSHLEVPKNDRLQLEARTADGRLIESFAPPREQYAQHYVYNVAGASPLVEWTACYGNVKEKPPRFIGAPRWLTSSADRVLKEPPASVKTKGGGATRTVLSGAGDLPPADLLRLVRKEAERRQLIAAHAQWDPATTKHAGEWRRLAGE